VRQSLIAALEKEKRGGKPSNPNSYSHRAAHCSKPNRFEQEL